MKIFGFEIKRAEEEEKQPVSFAEPQKDDGALTVGTALGGSYGILIDMEGSAKTEAELVTRYRSMSLNPEIQMAVDEIVNEAISVSSDNEVVKLVLDDVDMPDKVKEKVLEEFEEVLELLDFSNQAYEIFSKFYIDGRLNYHAIIDEKNLKDGIKEIRYIDPRKIRLIREMEDKPLRDGGQNVTLKKIRKEYYVYSDNGFGTTSTSTYNNNSTSVTGIQIAKDSIVRVTSGKMNETNSVVLSYLHNAIRPLNQLRMLEDATVIYTLTRAPERRVFYIDVGNLPKAKAEQYLHDMMARHKNKVNYDPSTGEIQDGRKMMTMTEDFWFPRREGNRSTEIETLPAGQGLGNDQNLPYFQTKLYQALNVPVARLQAETMSAFGRPTEVTREELKFSMFVRRLRARFSMLFDLILEKQLILKGIITPEEWRPIKNKMRYDFIKENYFEELKALEILKERVETANSLDALVGKYFSRQYIVSKVLGMPDEEWEEMKKEMAKEEAEDLEKQRALEASGQITNDQQDEQEQEQEEPAQQVEQPIKEENQAEIELTETLNKFLLQKMSNDEQ